MEWIDMHCDTLWCLAEYRKKGTAASDSLYRNHLCVDVERLREAGCAAMRLAEAGLRPSDILTPAAFRNAIIVHSAIGGSTKIRASFLMRRPQRSAPVSQFFGKSP